MVSHWLPLGLDILVCNAGGTSSIGVKVRDLALNAMDLDLGLNFVAPFIMTKAALPHLQKTRGQILYISSPIATKPYIGAGTDLGRVGSTFDYISFHDSRILLVQGCFRTVCTGRGPRRGSKWSTNQRPQPGNDHVWCSCQGRIGRKV